MSDMGVHTNALKKLTKVKKNKLKTLIAKHREYKERLRQALRHPYADESYVNTLKKEKLYLKDLISFYSDASNENLPVGERAGSA